MRRSVTNFIPISDEQLLLQVQSNPINMNIIQINTITATKKSEEEVEFLYRSIKEVFCRLPKNNLNNIIGDYNAKFGKRMKTAFVGFRDLEKEMKKVID
jgi:hypothetical protein